MPADPQPAPHGERVFAIDAAATAAVGVAICLASNRLTLMTALVPAVLALRFGAWSRLPLSERELSVGAELAFFTLCMVLGAGNDWNSVVRHRIYDYAVPPAGRIPFWMLLYWGMILRFVASLCQRIRRSVARPIQPDRPLMRVTIELTLVIVTRQMIYRHYTAPILSWLPFGLGLLAYAALFGITAPERRLVALAATVGPLVEVLFIQVGGLHRYHLGWLGGVPLWIVLWWMLSVLVWNDVSARVLSRLARLRIA